MTETVNAPLSSVIVSIATAVSEANRILSENSNSPMGITEFIVKYNLHATLEIPEVVKPKITLERTSSEMVTAKLDQPASIAARLQNITSLSPRERILSGYTQEADLTITAKIEPILKFEKTN